MESVSTLTIFLLMFGGGVGAPVGVPPAPQDPLLSKAAPEECLFYANWSGMATPDPNSKNSTERLMAEPEIQAIGEKLSDFLQQASTTFKDALPPDMQEMAQQGPELLKSLFTRSGAMWVSSLQMKDGEPVPHGAMLADLGEQLPQVLAILEKMQPPGAEEVEIRGGKFHRMDVDGLQVTWGSRGRYLVVGAGENAVEQLFKNAVTPVPQWLAQVHKRYPVPRVSRVSYLNLGQIGELISLLDDDAPPQEILQVLGVDSLDAYASVSGLDDVNYVTRSGVSFDGPPRGIFQGFGAKPLHLEDLAKIPANATIAGAMRFDLNEFHSQLETAMRRLSPESAEQMAEGIQMFEQMAELRLQEDLLDGLGDVWTVYADPHNGGVFTGWTVTLQVKDAEVLRATHDKLMVRVREMLQQTEEAAIQEFEHEGETVYYFVPAERGFPVAPSWALTDDELIIGAFPQAVKAHLSRDPANSLARSPGAAKLFADQGPVWVSTIRTRVFFDTFYSWGLAVAQAFGQNTQFGDALAILPASQTIGKHLQPTFSAGYFKQDRFETASSQTLPGAGIGTSAPVLAALLLPAAQSAREAARRAQSMNNLKQIALAMHNYHDTFRKFPAAYNVDKNGKPLLSWRVHILPFIEQQALYEQFKLDEPWDSEHNRPLADMMPEVYRDPSSTLNPQELRTNYLAIRHKKGVIVEPDEESRKYPEQMPRGIGMRSITDGTSNTLLAVSASDQKAVIWTKPDDFTPDPKNPIQGLLGVRPNGFLAAFCDGSVQFISEDIDKKKLPLLFQRDDGQPVLLP